VFFKQLAIVNRADIMSRAHLPQIISNRMNDIANRYTQQFQADFAIIDLQKNINL